jgi:hypothetical protein
MGDQIMKTSVVDRALLWFAYAWISFAIICLIAKVIEAALHASTWYGSIGIAVTTMWEMYDPLNIIHLVAEIIFISPALGALWLRGKLRERRWAKASAAQLLQ